MAIKFNYVIALGVFGEGIKKGSFSITNHYCAESPPQTNWEYALVDDKYGNLIDTTFDSTNFVSKEHNILYLGFNEKYREYEYKNNKLDYVMDFSPYKNTVNIINKKLINYSAGIPTTHVTMSSVAANFNGSYLHVKRDNKNKFNFTSGNDFAFSFWINIPPTQSILTSNFNPLFDKKTIKDVEINGELITTSSLSNVYPFDICISNSNVSTSGSIYFKQKSDLQSVEIYTTQLTSSVWHHVVCQKTGSQYAIWLDGVINVSQSLSISNRVSNDNEFYITSDGTDANYFSGSFDEVRIYNKGLNANEILYLSDNHITQVMRIKLIELVMFFTIMEW